MRSPPFFRALEVLPHAIFLGCASMVSGLQHGTSTTKIIDLQYPHHKQAPDKILESLAETARSLDIESIDVYGDFEASPSESWLRKFELEVCSVFGKEDALFLPSGTMAQSIALKIHASRGNQVVEGNAFACHETSHLLLWEEESYEYLLNMDAFVVERHPDISKEGTKNEENKHVHSLPMAFSDVHHMFELLREESGCKIVSETGLTTLILELPHRELGGKLTAWEDVEAIGELCRREGVAYHLDGARIFEAAAGYGKSLSEVVAPFDSVYISFYKGLGAISGAMLLGKKSFCEDARIWLSRFGGNLYSLLPYAVSCWGAFRKHVVECELREGMTFEDKFVKMRNIMSLLASDEIIAESIVFDPPVPQTSMIHFYFLASLDQCKTARDAVELELGVKVFSRIREVESSGSIGCKTEWAIGDSNGAIPDEIFLEAWSAFARKLQELREQDNDS
uniref:Aromatic amino acid beta-eliminating lyase/threonine aldolase domain-containing protein n=1 Tax=Leptocylindrus danicus TaxID=163516 RepID=A0A7S2LGJ1_9STRA|mmetsp:Transcript_5135/g.7544  ORF Transcript_5135/g.7544 Transcript_5135/m.7544 type:complete len:453 (+) Transcript_5135:235-1593(+)